MNSHSLGTNGWWPPDEAAAQEYLGYAEEFDRSTCLEHYDRVVDSCRAACLGNDAGRRVAEFLRDRIANKTPSSLIRLGDADGNLLFTALGIYPELAAYNLAKISRIYFGSNSLMADHRCAFLDIVTEAIASADLVGGPERGTIDKSFDTPHPDLDVRGMCGMRGVYNYLAIETDLDTLSDLLWASTWFSRALMPHYFGLLEGQPYVGLITCYATLGDALREHSAIERTETILVPMQASIAKLHTDIRHYPDAYAEAVRRIQPPYQGAVYLVAAGILSKSYCALIKERGGIAVDVGSVADVWMGRRSRPDVHQEFVDRWKIASESAA
jgi:hypothetical protein